MPRGRKPASAGKRGRPKGSKNKVRSEVAVSTGAKRGRPAGQIAMRQTAPQVNLGGGDALSQTLLKLMEVLGELTNIRSSMGSITQSSNIAIANLNNANAGINARLARIESHLNMNAAPQTNGAVEATMGGAVIPEATASRQSRARQ